jgi:hypothetical protein
MRVCSDDEPGGNIIHASYIDGEQDPSATVPPSAGSWLLSSPKLIVGGCCMQVVSLSGKPTTTLRKRAENLGIDIFVEKDGESISTLASVGVVALCTSKVNIIASDKAMQLLKNIGVGKGVKETLRYYRSKAKEAQATGVMPETSEEEQEGDDG